VNAFDAIRDVPSHSKLTDWHDHCAEESVNKRITHLKRVASMSTQAGKALEYLDMLEADRQAALALSQKKAEEAKLMKARQEGFQAAMEILGKEISVGNAEPDPTEHGRRQVRRQIPQLILRELSFSGQAMTVTQIARAIDYIPERTETALQRMEEAGQVLRNVEGRWAIGRTAVSELNGHAAV
jgi:hypothetical protein